MEGKKNQSKEFDHVAHMKCVVEVLKKSENTAINWLRDYEWLCDEYKNLHEEMKKICKEKKAAEEDGDLKKDVRSAMPFPITTNGLYGWLAAKHDFILEQPGFCMIKYPNPLDDVTLLSGDLPTLAAGKGLI